MVSLGCPDTSVSNYQLTLRNISEERRSHMTIAYSDGGLGLASHGPVQSDPFWRGPGRRFLREFQTTSHIYEPNLGEKTLVLHSSNYGSALTTAL